MAGLALGVLTIQRDDDKSHWNKGQQTFLFSPETFAHKYSFLPWKYKQHSTAKFSLYLDDLKGIYWQPKVSECQIKRSIWWQRKVVSAK